MTRSPKGDYLLQDEIRKMAENGWLRKLWEIKSCPACFLASSLQESINNDVWTLWKIRYTFDG